MNTILYKILAILFLLFVSITGFAQSKQEKTIVVIKKLQLVENQKMNFQFLIQDIKYSVKGNDSIKLIEIEDKLNDEEILKRITAAFNETFSDDEINDTYSFLHSTAFERLFKSKDMFKTISEQFEDIHKEINDISERVGENPESIVKRYEEPHREFIPIPTDKEDGFYAVHDYYISGYKYLKLEEKPSLTKVDITDIKKAYSDGNVYIDLTLSDKGAKKFYFLTKNNITKPIAIVIDKKIVSAPIVNSTISGGKVNISGNFTEEEVDLMIEKLKVK